MRCEGLSIYRVIDERGKGHCPHLGFPVGLPVVGWIESQTRPLCSS